MDCRVIGMRVSRNRAPLSFGRISFKLHSHMADLPHAYYPRRMRLLVYSVSVEPKVDGISRRVTNFLKELKKVEISADFGTVRLASESGNDSGNLDILLLCPDFGSGTPMLMHETIRVVRMNSFSPLPDSAPETKLAWPFCKDALREVFESFQPDIAHFIGPDFCWFAFLKVCNEYNVPILASYHQHSEEWLKSQALWMRWLFRPFLALERAYNKADFVIAPSEPIRDFLNHKRGIRCDAIWPPAVDASETGFNPCHYMDATRNVLKLGCTSAVPVLLYVGRVAPEKGLHVFDPLMTRLQKRYGVQCPHLAVIGSGPLGVLMRQLHGRDRRVFFSDGYWSGDALRSAYASADIFIMPSSFETLGNVALEAMASGLVVVAANAGGLPYVVKDGETGFLYPPDDVDTLEDVVSALVDAWFERQSDHMEDGGNEVQLKSEKDEALSIQEHPIETNMFDLIRKQALVYVRRPELTWEDSTLKVASYYAQTLTDQKRRALFDGGRAEKCWDKVHPAVQAASIILVFIAIVIVILVIVFARW